MEAHSMSSELLLQQCSVSTDEAQRSIEVSCQEKALRVVELTNDLDSIKSKHSRLNAKLIRIRKELRDRKVSSSPSREVLPGSVDRNMLRNQVLIDEEDSLIQQLMTITNSVNLTMKECESSLKELVHDFKSEVQQQLEGIVTSYQEFLDSNNIKFNMWQRVIRKVRDDVEKINVEEDLSYYRERVQYRYSHHLTTLKNTNEDLGLPKIQPFCAISNDVVDLERSNERESLVQEDLKRPVSPSSEQSSGGNKVFGSIIGGIKAIGDRGLSSGSHIMEGVSRGRMSSSKREQDTRRRSKSSGDGTKQNARGGGGSGVSSPKLREKELSAVNDDYQKRRRHSLSARQTSSSNVRSMSDGVADSERLVHAVELAVERKISSDMDETNSSDSVSEKVNDATGLSIDAPSRAMLEPLDDVQDEVPFKIPEPLKELPVKINPELVKFGIAGEQIIEHFSCALIPKRGLLTHGRMFITKNHIAFSGWPELRVLIPLVQVEKLKKTNTVYIIPNAITINTMNGDRYFFGSFIDRDPCFEILSSMVNIAKSLVQVMGPGPSSNVGPVARSEQDAGTRPDVVSALSIQPLDNAAEDSNTGQ